MADHFDTFVTMDCGDEFRNSFTCVAAIGNLSGQAGFALKKVLGHGGCISRMVHIFFRETEKEFPTCVSRQKIQIPLTSINFKNQFFALNIECTRLILPTK